MKKRSGLTFSMSMSVSMSMLLRTFISFVIGIWSARIQDAAMVNVHFRPIDHSRESITGLPVVVEHLTGISWRVGGCRMDDRDGWRQAGAKEKGFFALCEYVLF